MGQPARPSSLKTSHIHSIGIHVPRRCAEPYGQPSSLASHYATRRAHAPAGADGTSSNWPSVDTSFPLTHSLAFIFLGFDCRIFIYPRSLLRESSSFGAQVPLHSSSSFHLGGCRRCDYIQLRGTLHLHIFITFRELHHLRSWRSYGDGRNLQIMW